MVSYQATPNVGIQFNINNLFDEDYINSINRGGLRYIAGAERNYRLTFNFKFKIKYSKKSLNLVLRLFYLCLSYVDLIKIRLRLNYASSCPSCPFKATRSKHQTSDEPR